MKAVIADAYGGPDALRLAEVPRPQPGPGKVRVAVAAAGVSFVDVLITAGRYQLRPPLPFVPGTEFSGTIEAVGEGVSGLKRGDRVCGSCFGGAFAEAVVVPAAGVVVIPEAMSLTEASVFRVSFTTAYYALVQRGKLRPGETVLVLGAGGAVGSAVCQVAKALGAVVIGSASTEARRDLALASGADHVLDARAEHWSQALTDLTGGRGVDIVVDPVGGAASEPAFRRLAWGGRHLVIGFVGGIARLPLNLALLKSAAVVGVDVRQFGERQPALAAENLQRLFALYAQGAIRPLIGQVYPLEAYAEAMAAAERGEGAGRVVLQVAAVG